LLGERARDILLGFLRFQRFEPFQRLAIAWRETEKMKKKRDFKDRIVLDQSIHFGKPCIAGTRIPVENVLELIEEGIAFDKIIEKYYPDLQIDDIKACAKYATRLVRDEEIHISLG
jgi:uncharacterized protein (DUF433 family)